MSASQRLPTTHNLIDRQLVLYKRERSAVWQCRFNVDGRWQRTTTGERDLADAKKRAHEILIEANVRKRMNVAPITRSFKNIALAAIGRMQKELDEGVGKVTYNDYISATKNYLIPFFGKHNVNSVDGRLIEEYGGWREKRMGKKPLRSTVLTHNAALNRVFDEAEIRGFMHSSARPKLKAKGEQGKRRAEFSLDEVRALRSKFDAWIRLGKADSRDLRALLRDYVNVLLDTGARPGDELLDLRWVHIEQRFFPVSTGAVEIEQTEGAHDEMLEIKANRTVFMRILTGKVSKKGGRTIVGRQPTAQALSAIAQRNYGRNLFEQLQQKSNDLVFTYLEYINKKKDKTQRKPRLLPPTSFSKLFDEYLRDHNLLIDPITKQKRVFYSLRHTYATLALMHDKVAIHTLAKQMGTSVGMIEKHYSHLDAVKAVHQLRGDESRQLMEAETKIDERYDYAPQDKKKKTKK